MNKASHIRRILSDMELEVLQSELCALCRKSRILANRIKHFDGLVIIGLKRMSQDGEYTSN